MQLVEGDDLMKSASRSHADRHAAELIVKLAQLSYAHKRGILHRDISREHLDRCSGVPHLTDFGLARLV